MLSSTSNLLDPQNPQSRFDMNQIIPSLSLPLPQDINQFEMIFSQRKKQTNFNQTLTTGWWSSHQKNLLVKFILKQGMDKMSRCQPVPSFLCAFSGATEKAVPPQELVVLQNTNRPMPQKSPRILLTQGLPRPLAMENGGAPLHSSNKWIKGRGFFMELRLSGGQLVAFWGTVAGIPRREGWSP